MLALPLDRWCLWKLLGREGCVGGGFLGAIRADSPSVISVTYGVSYAPHNTLRLIMKTMFLVPKGSNFGSERVKLWFRKGQTDFLHKSVPDRSKR